MSSSSTTWAADRCGRLQGGRAVVGPSVKDALHKAGLACIGFIGTAKGRELASGRCGLALGSLRFAPGGEGPLESGAGHRAGWGLRRAHYPDS